MNKTRKRIIQGILLFAVVFGVGLQASASAFTSWRNFQLPPGMAIVDHDTNGRLLSQRTQALPHSNLMSRQARVGSQNQSMWSTPEVRIRRSSSSPAGSWTSDEWRRISNNGRVDIDIPMAIGLDYRVQVRSSAFQNFTNTVELRLSVNRYRAR